MSYASHTATFFIQYFYGLVLQFPNLSTHNLQPIKMVFPITSLPSFISTDNSALKQSDTHQPHNTPKYHKH